MWAADPPAVGEALSVPDLTICGGINGNSHIAEVVHLLHADEVAWLCHCNRFMHACAEDLDLTLSLSF